MSINVNDKNLGHATAYAYYKAGGGTMTEAEFTEFMADFGTASQTAVEAAQAALASKNAAQTAATTATTKASEASTSATNAAGSASSAASSATAASGSATSAAASATTASGKASEAAQSATSANTAKTEALTAKTAAQAAQTAAETAQGKAETAQGAAEDAAESVSASVAQISQNTSDITELKEDLGTALINSYPTLTFENGYIKTNGALDPAYSQFKTTDYIAVDEYFYLSGTFRNLSSNYNHINCYDADKAFISGMIPGTGSGSALVYDKEKFTFPENTFYVRITDATIFYKTISIILPSIAVEKSKTMLHGIQTEIDSIERITGYFETQTPEWESGCISKSGIVDTTATSFNRTDLIPIPSDVVGYEVKNYTLNSVISAICFYSSNEGTPQDNYISSFYTETDVGAHYDEIPYGAKYFACSKAASNNLFTLSFIKESEIYGSSVKDAKTSSNYEKLFGWLGFSAFSKFASVGDSLSVGYHTESDETQVSKDLSHSWGAYVEKRTGTKSYWTGTAGATCKTWLESNSESATWGLGYCRTLGTMPLYVICMGANEYDISVGSPSDIGSENPTTLYGYVSKLISELRTISPNSYIVCTGVSRRQNSSAINAVYKYICEHTSKCYYLDCEKEFNSEVLKPYYYNFHYSASGYSVIAKLFDYKLSEAMQNNVADFLYINEIDAIE